MKVAKWGNSLAIRIPAAVAEQAGLKEGDEATLSLTPDNVIEIRSDDRRRQAIEMLKKLRFNVPAGNKFARNEIYDS